MARLTRHEILKEDKFIKTVERTRHFLATYQKQILMGLGLVGAGILLVAGYFYYSARESEKARDQLSQALSVYHAPVSGESLESSPVSPMEPTYQTAQEKYEKALAGFRAVSENYSSRPSGKIAQYYQGLSLQNLGRHDEAIAALQPLSQEKSDYGALALSALASIYERQGKLGEAADAYRRVADLSALTVPKNVTLMRLAELYVQQQKPEEAAKVYHQVVKEFPGTSFSTEAEEKLKEVTQ